MGFGWDDCNKKFISLQCLILPDIGSLKNNRQDFPLAHLKILFKAAEERGNKKGQRKNISLPFNITVWRINRFFSCTGNGARHSDAGARPSDWHRYKYSVSCTGRTIVPGSAGLQENPVRRTGIR